MTSLATQTAMLLKTVQSSPAAQQQQPRVLVLSPHFEVRQSLLRTLEGFSADVIACAAVTQAVEVLSRQPVDLVFCDEHLTDGSYSDLIDPSRSEHKSLRVVVVAGTGEWEFYFDAVGKGAFDVVRSPWYATDVEMVVIRAMREVTSAPSQKIG
jgi:DNA-binding NtrC family response regulator